MYIAIILLSWNQFCFSIFIRQFYENGVTIIYFKMIQWVNLKLNIHFLRCTVSILIIIQPFQFWLHTLTLFSALFFISKFLSNRKRVLEQKIKKMQSYMYKLLFLCQNKKRNKSFKMFKKVWSNHTHRKYGGPNFTRMDRKKNF